MYENVNHPQVRALQWKDMCLFYVTMNQIYFGIGHNKQDT